MEIKIDKRDMIREYNIGDLIALDEGYGHYKGDGIFRLWMIVEEDKGYILRRADSGIWQGWNAHHKTIGDLIDSIEYRILEHYSIHDYELTLKYKEGER